MRKYWSTPLNFSYHSYQVYRASIKYYNQSLKCDFINYSIVLFAKNVIFIYFINFNCYNCAYDKWKWNFLIEISMNCGRFDKLFILAFNKKCGDAFKRQIKEKCDVRVSFVESEQLLNLHQNLAEILKICLLTIFCRR